jgi:hypothetical protein
MPVNTNMNRSVVIIIVVAAVALLYFARGLLGGGSTTIEYRGETFNMSKAYSSYEDYKDDPNNLATNEFSRIEREITNAPVPSSFGGDDSLARAVLHLKFPGYGCGGLGNFPQSDGSTCGLYFLEIPMLDKGRYFLDRTAAGRDMLLDDFVMSSTNEIKNVRVDGTHIFYYDGHGALLRDKQM